MISRTQQSIAVMLQRAGRKVTVIDETARTNEIVPVGRCHGCRELEELPDLVPVGTRMLCLSCYTRQDPKAR